MDKVNARTGNLQPSTFFDASWSQARIEYEVAEAFKAGRADTPVGRSFIGTTPAGVKIQFFSDSGRTTFSPIGS
ncbi:MAG: EndoU domain-containing protein [Burkholderiales bacterium]|nr:EndoU domain-containing protein [Burkholderiales bacterium]